MAFERRSIEQRPCGIETEFGVLLRSGTAWIDGSGYFVRAFDTSSLEGGCGERVGWNPDARIHGDPGALEDHVYFRNKSWLTGSNVILSNGARFYLDGAHAEISTPLCLNARDCVVWNRACYAVIDRIRKKYKESHGMEFTVYRNNVAGRADSAYEAKEQEQRARYGSPDRVSFACHENYTVLRAVSVETLVQVLGCGWFPARIPVIGAGKIGSDNKTSAAEFQMSQRADFMDYVSGSDTMHHRGIYNLRDVPYADPARFRRMHVICGDSNMSAIQEFLKIALTDIVLKMVEDKAFCIRIEFLDPVGAMKSISRDTEFKNQYDMANRKKRMPILDILSEYCEGFAEYVMRYYPYSGELTEAIGLFAGILSLLKRGNTDALVGTLDWVTKRHIISAYAAKRGVEWGSDRALQLDYEYSNNDHDNGLWFRLYAAQEQSMISAEACACAEQTPPPSRSRLIARIIRAHVRHIGASNYWDHIVLKGSCAANHEQHVFLPDPTRAWDSADEELVRLPFDECIREGIARGIFLMRSSPPVGYSFSEKNGIIGGIDTNRHNMPLRCLENGPL